MSLSSGKKSITSMSETNAEEGPAVTVALFVSKVWKIVNQPETDKLISWSENGKTFTVHQETAFAKEVLPHYFKHNNFTSFVRQLNLYGFRKVAKPDHGGLMNIKDESVVFWHTYFRKGHPDLLPLIQRRSVSKSDDKNSDISRLFSDIHQMKGKQESIAILLDDLKDENEYLKREVQALKEKHEIQYKVLNKIIHFVVQMVYKGRMPLRKNRLMLTDAESVGILPPAKRSNLSIQETLDIAPNSPTLYNVSSPGIPSIQSLPSSPDFLKQSLEEDQSQNNMQLPPITSDDSVGTFGNPSVISGDELLADLLNPSTMATSLQSQSPVITTPSQIDSFNFHSQMQHDSSILSEPPSQVQPQAQLQSTTSHSQHTQPQTVDLVPYNRMNHLATHLDSHQAELDSLPDTMLNQLDIDPSVLTGLLMMDYAQPIVDYDVVDTARLLESFMNPNPEKDVCHESTIQFPNSVGGCQTLALPSGVPSGDIPVTTCEGQVIPSSSILTNVLSSTTAAGNQ